MVNDLTNGDDILDLAKVASILTAGRKEDLLLLAETARGLSQKPKDVNGTIYASRAVNAMNAQ
jgi:hypothetical protein